MFGVNVRFLPRTIFGNVVYSWLAVLIAVIVGRLVIAGGGVGIFDRFVHQSEPMRFCGERKSIYEGCGTLRVIDRCFHGGDGRLVCPFPKPFAGAACDADGLGQIVRGGGQDAQGGGQVGFAGAVAADQHIQRPQSQFLAVGAEGQQVLQTDFAEEGRFGAGCVVHPAIITGALRQFPMFCGAGRRRVDWGVWPILFTLSGPGRSGSL